MNHFEQHIRDTAHTVALTSEARERIRARLSEYVAYKPLRNAPVPTRMQYFFSYRMVASALMFTLVLGGWGTAYAAEDALPGEALYTVKEISEAARALVRVSPESRIAWDTERALRRLEETRALAQVNALSEETQRDLEQRFELFKKRAETRIATIESDERALAYALRVELESGIRAHTTHVTALAEEPVVLLADVSFKAEEPVARVALQEIAPVALHMVESEPADAMMFSIAHAPQEDDSERGMVEDIAPLERALARQEKRLEKKLDTEHENVRAEIKATMSAIELVGARVRAHTSDESDTETQAFLEAAIEEVQNARAQAEQYVSEYDVLQ